MSYVTILIALVLAFVAYKMLVGLVKFAAIGVILVSAAYLYLQGPFL